MPDSQVNKTEDPPDILVSPLQQPVDEIVLKQLELLGLLDRR